MREIINIPPFAPDKAAASTFAMNGMRFARDGVGGAAWRIGAVLGQKSPVSVNLDPSASANADHNVPDLSKLDRIESPRGLPVDLRRTIIFYQDAGLRVVHSDNSVRALSSESGLETLPNVNGFVTVFNELLLAIYPDGTIAQLNAVGDGGAILNTNLSEARRSAQADGASIISSVANWQGRLFLAIGDTLFWSDVNNAREWAIETDEGQATLAGWNQFPETDKIDQIAVFGNRLYAFADSRIHQVNVSDIDSQFSLTELVSGISFLGGAIGWQNGLYYVSSTGIRRLSGAVDESVSGVIEEVLSEILITKPDIYVTARGDEISWWFADDCTLLTLDVKDLQWRVLCDDRIATIGSYAATGKTIGDLDGQTLSQLNDTPLSFFSASDSRVCAASKEGDILFWELPEIATLDFNLSRHQPDSRVYIREIKFDELAGVNHAVWIKDGEKSEFVDKFEPDRWGNIVIERLFQRPDIRLEVHADNFKQVSVFQIEWGADKV